MIRRLAVVIAVVACSTAGPAPDVTVSPMTDRVMSGGAGVALSRSAETIGMASPVAAPVEAVFAALAAVYRDDLKVAVTESSPTQHALGNQALRMRRRIGGVAMQTYIDCGGQPGQPNAETFDIELNLMSAVTADPNGGSIITTRVSAIGSDPNHGQGNQMRCSSTGELEARIAKMVKQQVAK